MGSPTDPDSTHHTLKNLLFLSQILGLLPTSYSSDTPFTFLVNYIIPLLQYGLMVAGFYWVQDEVANFRATSLSSTLISVTILQFILASFTLVHAITKHGYIDEICLALDSVNEQLIHFDDKPSSCQYERKQCTLKWTKQMTVFFVSYLMDGVVVHYVLNIHLLALLSIFYLVHLRILLLSLHLFILLSLIQSRFTRLNTKLANSLAFKSNNIFNILPSSVFISHSQYKRLALIHNILSECCDRLNATFSSLVCLLLTHHVVVGVLSLYWTSVYALQYYEGGEGDHIYIYVGQVALLHVRICAHVWYLLSMCNMTQVKNDKTVELINKLFIVEAQTKVNQELRHVRDQLKRHSISFSPYGLFELDMHFFYTFVTVIITYWVILVQFQV